MIHAAENRTSGTGLPSVRSDGTAAPAVHCLPSVGRALSGLPTVLRWDTDGAGEYYGGVRNCKAVLDSVLDLRLTPRRSAKSLPCGRSSSEESDPSGSEHSGQA